MKKSLIHLFSHGDGGAGSAATNTTNILINHYYCGRKIRWYHHSGRKPNFSSETSSIWLLVSNALFPLVISANSVVIGHTNFLSWTSLLRLVRGHVCFPAGEAYRIYPSTEEYIPLLRISEDSAHKTKAFPVYITTSLVLPRKEKIIFSSHNTYLHR